MKRKKTERASPVQQTRANKLHNVRLAAVRAKAAADAKKAAADAVAEKAAHLKHAHDVTCAEHDRLCREHQAQEAKAARLAAEAAKPWHQRWFGL